MAFPAGPYTNGQTHTEAGVTYTYNSTIGGWHKPAAAAVTAPATTITGINSVTGGGDFSTSRTYQLVNDVASPPIGSYYGTGATGIRGWQSARSTGTTYWGSITATPLSVVSGGSTSGGIWNDNGGNGLYTRAANGLTMPANRLQRVRLSINITVPGLNVFLWDLVGGGALQGGATDNGGNYIATWLGKPTTSYRLGLRASTGAAFQINYCRIDAQTVD